MNLLFIELIEAYIILLNYSPNFFILYHIIELSNITIKYINKIIKI